MTKQYFTPLEFPELAEPKPKVKEETKKSFDIAKAVLAARFELGLLASGQSKLRKTALQFPASGGPVQNTLSILEANPTPKAARQFIECAKQDLGLAVAKHFVNLFKDLDPDLSRITDGR